MRYIVIILGLVLTLNASLVSADQEQKTEEWVVVLDDPRPARLQGWKKTGYSKDASYRSSLALKRFGKRIASDYEMELLDQWFISSLGVYCLVVKFNGDDQDTIKRLQQNEAVQWVQPSNNFQLLSNKVMPSMNQSESLLSNSLLRDGVNGQGITIAMIDSAVDVKHKDFAGAIDKTTDLVVSGSRANKGEAHGTAIASVIITQPETKLGVTGISPSAKLEAYRGCWELNDNSATHCNTLSLARALDAVANSSVDILNLSLSGPQDSLLDSLLDRIIAQDVIVVAAFDPLRPTSMARFPNKREGVLIVRAEGLHDQYGGEFTAPGARVVASPNGNYDFMEGHSVAAAYTSGVIALCKQAQTDVNRSLEEKCGWKGVSGFEGTKELVYTMFRDTSGVQPSARNLANREMDEKEPLNQ